MVDEDVAKVFGVSTQQLVSAVEKNRKRFPSEFLIHLSSRETTSLRAQGFLSGSRRRAMAFTELGLVMAALVIGSRQAVEYSIAVVRAFLSVREIAAEHQELGREIQCLKRRQQEQRGQLEEMAGFIRQVLQPIAARKQVDGASLN